MKFSVKVAVCSFGRMKQPYHFGKMKNLAKCSARIVSASRGFWRAFCIENIFDKGGGKGLYIKNLKEEERSAEKNKENCQCLPSGAQSHVLSIDYRTRCYVWWCQNGNLPIFNSGHYLFHHLLCAWPLCIPNGFIRLPKDQSFRMLWNNLRLLVSLDAVPAQIASTFSGTIALKANAIFTAVAIGSRLWVTAGHFGSRNDKTIIQFDKFIQNLQSGVLYL